MFRAAVEVSTILLEKPFAPSLPDADEMVALAAGRYSDDWASGARFQKTIRRIRGIIHNGEIGPGKRSEFGRVEKRTPAPAVKTLVVLGTSFASTSCSLRATRGGSSHVTQEGRDITPRDGHQGTERVGLLAGDARLPATFLFDNALHGHFDGGPD